MKFYEAGIPIYGIRFPYLRADEPCLNMIKELSIDYDNSCSFWWNVDGWENGNNGKIIEKMKKQYSPSFPENDFVLPFFKNSLVRIPASLPDDDLLWDRAGLNKTTELEDVWKEILRRTLERGELFVLILHPERYEFLRSPFLGVLKEIKEQRDQIWVRPLRDISEWWQKRAQAYIECEFAGKRTVKVQIQRPRELNYVFYNFHHSRNIKLIGISQSNFVVEEFEVRMPTWPVIGMGPKTSRAFREMLKNLGFWVDDESGFPEIYSVYFEEDPVMESRYQWLRDFLAKNKNPLIRFNNWPENFQSAFAVTGDIDAMTRQDFFSRI
ncbi:MAG: hypothetical protein P8184_07835 [Calditrichia bacterium]